MRSIRLGIVVAFTLAAVGQGYAQDAMRPFSLFLKNPGSSILTVGTPIPLEITITNTSNGSIPVMQSVAESDFIVDVRKSDGQYAQWTAYGKDVAKGMTLIGGMRVLFSLAKGESLKNLIVVTNIYDLNTPDTYTISVRRVVPDYQEGAATVSAVRKIVPPEAIVRSNQVTITVKRDWGLLWNIYGPLFLTLVTGGLALLIFIAYASKGRSKSRRP